MFLICFDRNLVGVTGSPKAPGEEVVSQNLSGVEHQWRGNQGLLRPPMLGSKYGGFHFVATPKAALI